MYVCHLLLDQDVNIAVQTFICLVSNEYLGQIHNVMTMLKLSSCLKVHATAAVLIKGLKNKLWFYGQYCDFSVFSPPSC